MEILKMKEMRKIKKWRKEECLTAKLWEVINLWE